jgi:ABC-type glycerol-3-phosphate transport system substrate-binding protein
VTAVPVRWPVPRGWAVAALLLAVLLGTGACGAGTRGPAGGAQGPASSSAPAAAASSGVTPMAAPSPSPSTLVLQQDDLDALAQALMDETTVEAQVKDEMAADSQ